ncbi:MAG: RnfABCDGE type electron transport complex subunit D [Bacteroidia bacterium]
MISISLIPNEQLTFLDWFQKDARHFQMIYQSVFLIYGINFLGWAADSINYFLFIFFSLITQYVWLKIKGKDLSGLKSGLITSLSLSMMFKAGHPGIAVLAPILAITSKYIFNYKRKHFFNPANFGIIISILITGEGWISPGQWGSDAVIIYLIGAAGLMIILKVKRLETAFAFLFTFLLAEFTRTSGYLGWEPEVFLHKITNGSLWLFTFFMITDPVSTPNHPKARLIWASCTGLLAFALGNFLFVNAAPLWALFIMSPLTFFFDKLFIHQKFKWIQS